MSERAHSPAAIAGTLFTIVALAASVAGVVYVVRWHPRVHPSAPVVPEAAPPPRPLTAQDIAMRSFASVVMVSTASPAGKPLAFGSGFVVDHGVVVTNFHVLKGASSATVRLIGDRELTPIEGIVAVDPKADLVLLSAPKLAAAPLDLRQADDPSIGEEVFVVGNPQDLEGTFSTGVVSGKRMLGDVRMLQITAPISDGSSGGPVLDRDAHVVGVASSSLRAGQNLNFAITGEYVHALLASRGAVQQIAKVTRPKPAPEPGRGLERVSIFRRLARLWPWR